jgi:uncharacterized Ntn-hydrolase superfamily protein
MRHGTYSIVARDPETGELGAAVQSHWFSVGSLCLWARAGVGAVATQSVVEPAHGPDALVRLAAGDRAADALAHVLGHDELAVARQVGIVDADGGVAVHTGVGCIAEAGHVTGPHYSCQANMMARDTVPRAMSQAFETAHGTLAERMMAALDAAEGQGGDVRGRQSAAMIVVAARGEPWRKRIDLRVEDSEHPLRELHRLLHLHRAYELADEADQLLAAGDADAAGERYDQAQRLAPESDELLFWAGLARAHAGELDAGVGAVRQAAAINPGWLVLLERLPPEFAPSAASVAAALRG